ncbi:MAG: hypothetical protein P4L53_09030 [Candidatus Obscuribacterales bacterium]|nr:hypothetical protein [Candidatus Obscuribacterales bacterium]
MSNFLADPIAIIQCIGAFWLGYVIFNFLKSHPKLAHLDDEHLFMCAAVPVAVLLLIVASHWLFTLALLGAGWFAMSIMAAQVALFVVGLLKIIHYGFKFFGKKAA